MSSKKNVGARKRAKSAFIMGLLIGILGTTSLYTFFCLSFSAAQNDMIPMNTDFEQLKKIDNNKALDNPKTPQDFIRKNLAEPVNDPKYYIVFSTDCSGYQKWQTYLLYYSAMRIQQPGTITRIASGCTKQQEAIERQFHSDIANHMSSDFKVHFTPDFSQVKDEQKKKYKFFNKPFGLLHWMEHSKEDLNEHDIIFLIDPDQVLTRKLTHDFTAPGGDRYLMGKTTNLKRRVEHGSPFAQL